MNFSLRGSWKIYSTLPPCRSVCFPTFSPSITCNSFCLFIASRIDRPQNAALCVWLTGVLSQHTHTQATSLRFRPVAAVLRNILGPKLSLFNSSFIYTRVETSPQRRHTGALLEQQQQEKGLGNYNNWEHQRVMSRGSSNNQELQQLKGGETVEKAQGYTHTRVSLCANEEDYNAAVFNVHWSKSGGILLSHKLYFW